MKLKRQTLDIQKMNLPIEYIDLTKMTREEICEQFGFKWFKYF